MTIPIGWMGSPNEKGAGATVGAATRTGGDFFPRRGVTFSPQVRALQRALQWELQPAERAQARQTFLALCHYGPKPPMPLVVPADVAVRHGARLCSRLCRGVVLVIFCSM